jgi:hypothetical protein
LRLQLGSAWSVCCSNRPDLQGRLASAVKPCFLVARPS